MKRLVGCAAVGLLAIIAASSAQVTSVHSEVTTKPNTCSIHCPAISAYPSLAGSVGCVEGTTPVCQCGDPNKMMAYCVAPVR